MKRTKFRYILIFIAPAIIIYLLIYFIPTVTVIATGFTKWDGAGSIRFTGLKNYTNILFEDRNFMSALMNSLKWGACAAFIHVPLGVIMALILNRKPFGWKFVRSVSLLPEVLSNAVKALICLFIFNPSIGLMNGFVRLLGFKDFNINWFFDERTAFLSVTLTWILQLGVIILITLGELFAIPDTYKEAAKIDSATDFQIDLYINLPLIRNIIGTCEIIAVTYALKFFDQLYLTTAGGPGNSTINVALLVYQSMTNTYQYGYANAMGTILLIMGIAVILIVTKVFRMNASSYE